MARVFPASHVCSNGGTCVNSGGSARCNCAGNFIGRNCDRCHRNYIGSNCDQRDYCVGHQCLNGGTCINGVSTDSAPRYTCECAYGEKTSFFVRKSVSISYFLFFSQDMLASTVRLTTCVRFTTFRARMARHATRAQESVIAGQTQLAKRRASD